MKLTVRDNGYNALVKRVFGLGRPRISVGIHEGEGGASHQDSKLTIAEVAEKNEFGYGVPERSFIRAWFDLNREKALDVMRRLMEAVVQGKRSKEQILELLGLAFVGEIQKRIAAGIQPANSPYTIARKGSSTPLIDKGQLRSSITYKVQE